jgi:hypothetical protein
MGDDGLTVRHGHEVDLATAAEKAFNRTASTVDSRLNSLKKHRDTLATRVEAALVEPSHATPAGAALAGEIRTHLKSLDTIKRADVLGKAVAAGDRNVVAAALNAPLFLSGLDEKQADELRNRARQKFAERDDAQLRAVEATIERVTSASTNFVGRYAKALKPKDSARSKAKARLESFANAS